MTYRTLRSLGVGQWDGIRDLIVVNERVTYYEGNIGIQPRIIRFGF